MLTRTVNDTAEALDVLAGYERGRRHLGTSPATAVRREQSARPAVLRIALNLDPPLLGTTLDPECERAARAAA